MDILTYAALSEHDFEVRLSYTGKKRKTTFWSDFTIADCYGVDAVKDTYERTKEWRSNVEMYAELVLVLNWKIWQHHDAGHAELASVYNDIWEEAHNWCLDNYEGEDFNKYYEYVD